MNVNWEQLQLQLGQQLAGSLKGLVEGAAGDLQAYATQISAELVLALAADDPSAVRELKAQLKLIAEQNRIAISAERERFVMGLIGATINAATSGLLAAGAQLSKVSA